MYKAFSLIVGEIEPKGSVISTNKILNSINIIFFYDEEDEVFSYAVQLNSEKFVIDICEDYGVADGETFRNSLPTYLQKEVNNILLSSIDFEEIEDENLEYISFSPLENNFDETLYETSDLFDTNQNYIAVQSITGWFNFNNKFLESSQFNSLIEGTLEKEFYLSPYELGEIENFNSETDKIILFKK